RRWCAAAPPRRPPASPSDITDANDRTCDRFPAVRGSPTVELVLHPVRLRIVQAFLGARRLTTAGLQRELADVTPATLYRHVGALHDGGVLEVVEERHVRGATERTYALRTEAASVPPEE